MDRHLGPERMSMDLASARTKRRAGQAVRRFEPE